MVGSVAPLGGARYSNLDRPMYAGNIYHKIRNANKDQEINIVALAAPSTEPSRRANSRDTFEYFLDYYHIKKGDNLLLVTSQIYVPYQWLKFIDLALEGAFHVECVGYSMCEKEAFAKPSNFLQEIKGTVNAIAILMKKYENV